MSSTDVPFLKGNGMIRPYIGFTQECGMVFKLERFFHLSGRYFGLGSLIGLEALSLMIGPYIGFTQECGIVFKLERFSHLLS